MPNQLQCQYCGRRFPTVPALRIHISKKQTCSEIRQRVLAKLNQRLAQAREGAEEGVEGGEDVDVEMEDAPAEPTHDIHSDPGIIPPAQSTGSGPGGREKVSRWVEAYPKLAGATKGLGQTEFAKVHESQGESDKDPWSPFESQDEWQLAQWLLHNVGQNATDEFLKLPIVSCFKSICNVIK